MTAAPTTVPGAADPPAEPGRGLRAGRGRRAWPDSRAWRTTRLVPLAESAYRGRILASVAMSGIQIFLYTCLWRAVYGGGRVVGGLDVRQAVSYTALAILLSRVRWTLRQYSKDAVPIQVREGTIAFWFLRPISPARYYLLRACGDAALGTVLVTGGLGVLLALGVLRPPASAAAGGCALAGAVLGQVVLYQLVLAVDLSCFWLVTNDSVNYVYFFLQDLLSGVFVPIWLFPGWLAAAANLLPFQAAVNLPVSLYVGRLPVTAAPGVLARQLVWCLLLAAGTRWLWRLAARRVNVQGG